MRNGTITRTLSRVAASAFVLLFGTVAHAVIPPGERDVLLRLYAATNGASWTTSTNWNGAVGTECSWYGVVCSNGATVVEIDLPNNNLTGSLPDLGELTNLQVFDVSLNQLSGSLPALAGLTHLNQFSVGRNQLSGSIPVLSGLTQLAFFSAPGNQLSGSIPALAGLTNLETLYLSQNNLTGPIPALAGLTSLSILDASQNQLTGSIPALAGLTKLDYFLAFSNQLSGSIPSLAGLTNLRYFSVYTNQLSGPIPALAGLTNLIFFAVDSNQLSGPIPALSGLTSLQYFAASHNQLSGSIPALDGLTNLREFNVVRNQLTGSIPTFAGLTNLEFFGAYSNQLSGPIPALVGLTKLTTFWVASNQLSGSIPALAGLTNLQQFLVYDNRLSGAIPALDGLANLQALQVSSNLLSGEIPSVPSPNALADGNSSLCPNILNRTANAAWDAATGVTPWYRDCTGANHQGLWWNFPAGSESGWGINLAHQNDIIFATWFTYGADNQPQWYTVRAEKAAIRVYAGPVSSFTGPPFDSVPFPANVNVKTSVGMATITFADDGKSATFTYTVNGITQTKQIVPQQFTPEVPLPVCVWGAQPDLTQASNYQDLWWVTDGQESGWGINFTHQGNIIFATWFTYDSTGKAWWLFSVARETAVSKVYSGEVKTATGPPFNAAPFNPDAVVRTTVGNATITVIDGNHVRFDYTVNAVTQTKNLTRQVFAPPGTVCE